MAPREGSDPDDRPPDPANAALYVAQPRDEYSDTLDEIEQSTRWSRTMRQLLEGF